MPGTVAVIILNFEIIVRFWHNQLNKVVTRFLDTPVVSITTAETLFKAMPDTMDKRNIPWTKVIGFASDSANVMVGKTIVC